MRDLLAVLDGFHRSSGPLQIPRPKIDPAGNALARMIRTRTHTHAPAVKKCSRNQSYSIGTENMPGKASAAPPLTFRRNR